VLGAIREAAREPGVAASQEEIAAAALRQAETGDLAGLEASVGRLRGTLDRLEREYRVEIVGGVWRYKVDDPNARNYYLRVQAVDPTGAIVPVEVRDEESGLTSIVREWAERVPQEVYDRVGEDKQDNGIVDENDFATKRRGWLTLDRRHPDVGQITRWDS
jgi:hypothetical protein